MKKALIFTSFMLIVILGIQFPLRYDATFNKTNSLNGAHVELLKKITQPLSIELYTTNKQTQDQVQTIVTLFQKCNDKIKFKTHFDVIAPLDKERMNLKTNHNLILEYENRRKAIDLNASLWSEQILSNLIYQMLKDKEQWVVFLTGHGEQALFEEGSRDLSFFATELQNKGFKVTGLNLGNSGVIPDNTNLLILADNKIALLPHETQQIQDYIAKGGNFLWLVNPDSLATPKELEKALGIKWLMKTLEDPKALAMGAPHPTINLINQYPDHPITYQVDRLSVFPWATALEKNHPETLGFEFKPFLVTNPSTYIKSKGETQTGPFILGASLTKDKQRIALIGNGHFISNASIRNYGNLMLAHHILNWLNEAETLSMVPSKAAIDLQLTQTPFIRFSLHYLFPYCLPLLFLGMGWLHKRRRLALGRIT